MAPQGHELDLRCPEQVLDFKEKAEYLTPIVSVFGHISLSESLRFLHRISVAQTKYNAAGMQRHTLRQNVITMWVRHLHQE